MKEREKGKGRSFEFSAKSVHTSAMVVAVGTVLRSKVNCVGLVPVAVALGIPSGDELRIPRKLPDRRPPRSSTVTRVTRFLPVTVQWPFCIPLSNSLINHKIFRAKRGGTRGSTRGSRFQWRRPISDRSRPSVLVAYAPAGCGLTLHDPPSIASRMERDGRSDPCPRRRATDFRLFFVRNSAVKCCLGLDPTSSHVSVHESLP